MVFLTSLDILDTGFLSIDSVTRLGNGVMVNGGAALKLKGLNFDIGSSANLDKAVSPDNIVPFQYEYGESYSLISINPTTISLTLFLNAENIDTSNIWGVNDMALLPFLLQLPQTRGLKALYYPVAGNFRQRSKQIVYQLGSSSLLAAQDDIDITLATSETASATGYDLTDVNYILVRFDNCKITQTPSNKIKVVLTGVRSA